MAASRSQPAEQLTLLAGLEDYQRQFLDRPEAEQRVLAEATPAEVEELRLRHRHVRRPSVA